MSPVEGLSLNGSKGFPGPLLVPPAGLLGSRMAGEWKWCTIRTPFGPYESKPRAGPYQPRRLASFAMLRAQKKLESKHVQEPIRFLFLGSSWIDWPTTDWLRPFLTDFFLHSEKEWNQWKVVCRREVKNGQRRRLWKRKTHWLMLFQPSCSLLSSKWMRERLFYALYAMVFLIA